METAKIKIETSDLSEQNRSLAEEEFRQKKLELKSLPQMIAVYTTDTCNLRCIGCHYGKGTASPLSISSEGYYRVFEVFPYVREIGIAGAEMFFDAGNPKGYVQKVISKAEKYPGIKFLGFTNGTLLTPERIHLIVDRFSWIGISIDSPYPEVYKKIRVGGQLEQVIANIKKISEYKAEKGLGRSDNPRIILSSIIMELTYKNVTEIVELADKVGAAQVNFLEPWEGTYEEVNILGNRVKILEYLDRRGKSDKLAGDLGISIQDRTRNVIMCSMPNLKERLKLSPLDIMGKWPVCCDAPWNEMYIWRNGDVRICCTSPTIIGNINDSSIFEIWNSPPAIDMRRRILRGNYIKDCQKNCHRGYALPKMKGKKILSFFNKLSL